MYKVLSYIQNYVKIKISGERPQKFINICIRRRIAIWELTRITENEYTMCMFASDFLKNIRAVAMKSGVKAEIIKKTGLRYTIRSYKSRKALLVLSLLMCALLALMSSMVWNITIEGADPASQQKTRMIASELGIKRGMFMTNINARVLADRLLSKQNNLCWVGVKKQGTTLCIQIAEGTYYESKKSDNIPQDEPCDIAVSKDCKLSKVTVENGMQQIAVGSGVLAGQVVVCGNGTHAKAEVLGCVWYVAEALVEKETEILTYTGNEQKERALLFFGIKLETPSWKWLPWNWHKESFKEYDSVYFERYMGSKEQFPLGFATLVKKETELKKVVLSKEEAVLRAKAEATAALDIAIPDEGVILNSKWEVVEKNGEQYYRITAEVLENVGISVLPQN